MGQLVQAKGGSVAVKADEAPSQYLTFALGSEVKPPNDRRQGRTAHSAMNLAGYRWRSV